MMSQNPLFCLCNRERAVNLSFPARAPRSSNGIPGPETPESATIFYVWYRTSYVWHRTSYVWYQKAPLCSGIEQTRGGRYFILRHKIGPTCPTPSFSWLAATGY